MNLLYKIKGLLDNNLYRNTFCSMSAKGVAMVLYMLTDIGIARIISVSEYGEWSYFYSMISMVFWIAWFGVNTSSKVYIARFQGEPEKQGQYLKASFYLRLIISIIILIIYYIIVWVFASKIKQIVNYPHLYLLLLFGGLLVFFSTFSEFFKEISIGLVNFKQIVVIAFIEFGGYLLFGVGLLWIMKNILKTEEYIIGIVIGYSTALFIVSIYGFSKIKIRLRHAVKVTYRQICEILGYAIPILLMSFGALIILELDTVMIGSIYEGDQVAIYSIAKKICSKVSHISVAICTATMTEFAVLNKSNIDKKKDLFIKLLRLNGIIITVIVLAFIFIVPFLIRIFYGEGYADSYMILYILTPYFIMNSFCFFMANLLDYQKKAKLRSIFYMVMIGLDIILNLIWIPNFGARGAAMATSVSVIPYFLFLIISSIKVFKDYKKV